MRRAILFLTFILAACRGEAPTTAAFVDDEQVFRSVQELTAASNEDGATQVFTYPAPFIRVGLMWIAKAEGAVLVRATRDGAAFTDWTAPTLVSNEEGARAGHVDVPLGTRGFQLRFASGQDGPTFVFAEPIDALGEMAQDGEPASAAFPTDAPAYAQSHQALAPFPTVHPRSAWGARAPKCSSSTSPYRAVVHHTADPTNSPLTAEQQLRQVQNYHMDSRGYCDIAYNYLVSRDARVWTGRGATTLGGHTLNHNAGNVAICYLGTYTDDVPTAAQMCSGAGMFAWLNVTYNIPLASTSIKGHRDYGSTACPGNQLYARLPEMISLAKNGCGGPPPTPAYAGQFLSQSFPAAHVGALTLALGTSKDGYFELKNVGTATWKKGSTRLATSPRGMNSPLAASNWLSPSRIGGLVADTAPGAVGRFNARLTGNTLGSFTQGFTLVEELVTWFADQGGPADNFMVVKVKVVPAPVDGGEPVDDGGFEGDGGEEPFDAGAWDGGTDDGTGEDDAGRTGPGGLSAVEGGCGCGAQQTGTAWLVVISLLALSASFPRGARQR